MGRSEHIPGLDPRDPKQPLFSTVQFAQLRKELGRATTIGEQHTVLERLFLSTKIVTIDEKPFDTMPKQSKVYNCDAVPAIKNAGIEHLFTWRRPATNKPGDDNHRMPRLSVVVAPRMIPEQPELTTKLKPETRIIYEFDGGELKGIRTTDQFRPVRLSYSPDQPLRNTLFEPLGEYICRRVEAQLVVVAGRGFFDKPEELPAPIPYTPAEL